MNPNAELLTIGQIAERVRRPVWQTQYIIHTRQIPYLKKAGPLRLFAPDVVPLVAQAGMQIDARRGDR